MHDLRPSIGLRSLLLRWERSLLENFFTHPHAIMNKNQSCIDACNKILRGEISAIETYFLALEKFGGSPDMAPLREIMEDHKDSADALRHHITEMGGVPGTDSGAWGALAKAVEVTAALMGPSHAVSALIQGEKHGMNAYEDALNAPEVTGKIKAVFRETLIPRLFEHIAALEDLSLAGGND